MDITGDGDCHGIEDNTGGEDCYNYKDITDDGDCYGIENNTGGEDC